MSRTSCSLARSSELAYGFGPALAAFGAFCAAQPATAQRDTTRPHRTVRIVSFRLQNSQPRGQTLQSRFREATATAAAAKSGRFRARRYAELARAWPFVPISSKLVASSSKSALALSPGDPAFPARLTRQIAGSRETKVRLGRCHERRHRARLEPVSATALSPKEVALLQASAAAAG